MDVRVALECIVTAHGPLLVASDYDGTLSGIVADPEAAEPIAGALEVLAALHEQGARVAIVSGRPVEFLLRAVPIAGVELVGQYGLERADGGVPHADARAAPFTAEVAAAADECDAAFADLYVERKGTTAVTVHWRAVGALPPERLELIDAIARRHGLAVHPTRMARELRPPLPIDKGTALAVLIEEVRPGAVLFAGDDRGDLAAFSAVDRAVEHGHLALGVKIGVLSSEVPPELVEAADVLVDGPRGVVALLERLRRARGGRAANRSA
jgi:trehalose 6-phosphate phosphatase